MTRRARAFLVSTTLILTIPGTAWAAEETSVSELIADSAAMAGLEVSVEGELVGDYGFRDDGWMWTQLNGDSYATAPIREGGERVGGNTGVGIRMPIALGHGLDPPGGYGNRGPLVRVTGIWKYHDPARQGESYLEVIQISVTEPGRPMPQSTQWMVAVVGLSLLGASLALWRWKVVEDRKS